MASKLRNLAGRKSVFYEVPTTEELRTGYLYKSPPLTALSKSIKTWKRRFFVLSKTEGHCPELKYYKDESKRDKPVGEIDLALVSLLLLHPESHPTWEWIQRNFRCSSSSVLLISVAERDYFLIGENSTEMDGWLNSILGALKTCPNSLIGPEENTSARKIRSISEPLEVKTSYIDDDLAEHRRPQSKATPPAMRRSAPETLINLHSHYDYPRSIMNQTLLKREDKDDDNEVKTEHNDEEDTDSESEYMHMDIVRRVASEFDGEHGLTQLTQADKDSEKTFLNNNTYTGSTGLNRQIPQQSETINHEKKDICVSQEELKNNVIFSEEAGKPCVSDLKHIQTSGLFHKGDQIVAINDLLTDSLDEVHTYLRRLSKDQVKLTILRQPGSRPLSGCSV